jgi:hypothetical protein
MSYKTTKGTTIAFLTLYVAIGIGNHFASHGQEDLYPFFSWFLFVEVPNRVQENLEVAITSAETMRLSSPVEIGTLPGIFKPGTDIDHIRNLSMRLAQALSEKNSPIFDSLQRELEMNFAMPVTYQIRRVRFDVIERFKSGIVLSVEPVAEFSYNPSRK